MTSESEFPNGLEAISKHMGLIAALKSTAGPLSLRKALCISQSEIGQLLSHYTGGRSYTKSTISLWERSERGTRLPAKYAMTDAPREAYRRLLADVVQLATDGRLHLRARMGKRTWSCALWASCAECKRPFQVRRVTDVHCRYHRRAK